MAVKPQNEKMIFEAALELNTAAERAAYLDRACGADPALKARIGALLQARDGQGDFLEVLIRDPGFSLDVKDLQESSGKAIGRYKLLEKIGEGGMAVVYMAQQEQPIRRKVALKIIKLGMDTKQVIARFEAERQALALMDHPNIAKVLDAGATDTGRPYFVMELVTGVSITEYCDKNNLNTRDRLGLFIQVCNAVQHAHQKGIIHRDIKPSNVMVTMHDSQPMPKVIDFGIAKATNQKLTEKTLFTRYAHIIGTPAYMSPEQTELSDVDIDTRSDIYSLGILLYELLTGTTPFDAEKLREAGYVEMQRIIHEEEPTKPSTKLCTLGNLLAQIAESRNTKPDQLSKLIRGDLDWIVMKSLEKDRERRYETAIALAADVQRHLKHESISAHAPKPVYRMRKFLRRNRVRVAAVLVLALLTVLGVITLSTWHENRLRIKEAESFRLAKAHTAYGRGDLAAALKIVETLLDSEHVGPEAGLLLVRILTDDRRYDEAVVELERLVAHERPEIAGAAHSLWARLLLESRTLYDETLREIKEHEKKAKELLPDPAEAYYLSAMTTLTIREKLALLDKALDLDGQHIGARRLRALVYYASKKFQRMKEDALVIDALEPQDPLGRSLCAIALRELGDFDHAIKAHGKAIGRMPKGSPQRAGLYDQIWQTRLRMGDYEQVLAEANEWLRQFPDEIILHFHVFCALTALGNYEGASALFEQVAQPDRASRNRFRDWSMKYISDTLDARRSWHPPDSKPNGIAFLAMQEAEEIYNHLTAKGAKRLISDGFSADWSPDGKKLAFSLGVRGTSGLAVFDRASQTTELLMVPGSDPKWSPDGNRIAFVRDRPALSLPELTAVERRYRQRHLQSLEVWIIGADGTGPKRLARGSKPSWSQDSQRVYYSSGGVRSVLIEDVETPPPQLPQLNSSMPSVSPDGTYVARVRNGLLKIVEPVSQSLIAQCAVPPRLWAETWAPDGRKFFMVDRYEPETTTGLWIYDLDTEQVVNVLTGPITRVSWTSDETRLALSLGPPFCEVWTADFDPNMPAVDAMGPGRTKEEYYQDNICHYSRVIEIDSNDAESYFRRARYHHYLQNKESYIADMNKYVNLLYPSAATNAQGLAFLDLLNCLWRSTPINLGPNVNGLGVDAMGGTGCLSADGLSLYFESSRRGGLGNHDIWGTSRATTLDPWGEPENLGSPINTEFVEGVPSVTDDGLSLFFTSNRIGGQGNSDIWMSKRKKKADPWGEPENLGPPVNTADLEWNHCISGDGQTLYFASTRPGGQGGFDIWAATRKNANAGWSEPVNLGTTVNSIGDDGIPTISADGLMLFYASSWPGGYGGWDIWVARRATTDEPWGEPVNLGPPINTSYWDELAIISPDGSTFYFSSTRPGGHGAEDIWYVPILPMLDDSEQGGDNDSAIKSSQATNRDEVTRESTKHLR